MSEFIPKRTRENGANPQTLTAKTDKSPEPTPFGSFGSSPQGVSADIRPELYDPTGSEPTGLGSNPVQNSDNPLNPIAKTAKSLPVSPSGSFGSSPIGVTTNISGELPEPWRSVIEQAASLQTHCRLLVRVAWPLDDVRELARLIDPTKLSQGLEVLSRLYPTAEAVEVCEHDTLEPLIATGDVTLLEMHQKVRPLELTQQLEARPVPKANGRAT